MDDNRPAKSIPAPAIQEALRRVLDSPEFRASKRLRRFLSYVVGKTLEGRADEIKEYSIGLEVFDREEPFDPRTDTIVRVEARRLRQQLAVYYQGSGRSDPVAIEVPRGGYIPAFCGRDGGHVQPALPAEAPFTGRPARRRRPAALIGGALVVLVAAAGLVLWWAAGRFSSRTPHHWRLQDSTLTVLDAQGRICWEKDLSPDDPRAVDDKGIRDKVLIADIDDDRKTEVLVNTVPRDVAAAGGSLLCFEQSGRLRWTHHYGSRKTFGDRTFQASYTGRFLRHLRVGGRPRLLTVAKHFMWYPSQAALLDPKSGAVMEEYWHPGVISEYAVCDIDGDGNDEVLFGGLNNPGQGLGHAGLALLKLPFSRSSARPALPGPEGFPPITGGGEIAYVLFPLPDVSKVMGQLPAIAHLSVDSNRHILVETPLPEAGGIVYTLDAGLNVKECRFSDNFASLHDRYRRQGLLDHVLTNKEMDSLAKVVRFSAAPDGNDPRLERFWRF
jgi:hypothetical protein